MFQRKDSLFIFGLTFVTVAAWVGFNIYHITVTSTLDEELQTQITAIDANFDMATLNKLKTREQVAPLYQFQADASASGSGGTTGDPSSTGTAEVSPTITPITTPTEIPTGIPGQLPTFSPIEATIGPVISGSP